MATSLVTSVNITERTLTETATTVTAIIKGNLVFDETVFTTAYPKDFVAYIQLMPMDGATRDTTKSPITLGTRAFSPRDRATDTTEDFLLKVTLPKVRGTQRDFDEDPGGSTIKLIGNRPVVVPFVDLDEFKFQVSVFELKRIDPPVIQTTLASEREFVVTG